MFGILLRQNDIQFGMMRAIQSYACTESRISSLGILMDEHVLLKWSDTGDRTICCATIWEDIPFLGSRFLKLKRYQQMVASDYKGVSMVSEEDDGDDSIVFVAENGKVYHLDRECTYLRPRIQTVMFWQIKTQRNQSGGIYYPCESCCRSELLDQNSSVYITSYGDRYHIRSTCSRLKRTVRAIHRSEAGNLPACSKCGT